MHKYIKCPRKNDRFMTELCPQLKRGVYVLGAEHTKFGTTKIPSLTIRDYAAEAAAGAFEQSGVPRDEIDLVIVSNAIGFAYQGQGHANALITSHLGLAPKPSFRVETACASGAVAMRLGIQAIEAGWADRVLVVGAEVMSGMDRMITQKVISGGGDALLEAPVGATFPGLYASYAMALIHAQAPSVAYGMDSLAYIALKNHHNAAHNPKAQHNYRIEDLAAKKGIEDVWSFLHNPKTNPPIAWPLRLFDCSPTSDGGAAVILAAKDVAQSYNGAKQAIEVKASAQATGYLPMGLAPSMTSLSAAEHAAIAAYKRLGIDPSNPTARISVAEVHDCFTSAEVLAIGDLHFFSRKESLDAARRGDTAIGGKIPVNTSGGLKAKGHPIAVTGLAQVVTARKQLLHQMPEPVQVKDANLALCHNVGGTGGTACVHIFSLPEVA
jgi:acetyl-CoA C-acetyltransferase